MEIKLSQLTSFKPIKLKNLSAEYDGTSVVFNSDNERAIHFYNQAQDFAQTNSLSFNWTLNIINGLSHDTSDSIESGCDLIFN